MAIQTPIVIPSKIPNLLIINNPATATLISHPTASINPPQNKVNTMVSIHHELGDLAQITIPETTNNPSPNTTLLHDLSGL